MALSEGKANESRVLFIHASLEGSDRGFRSKGKANESLVGKNFFFKFETGTKYAKDLKRTVDS
jgi:hypothetical protein